MVLPRKKYRQKHLTLGQTTLQPTRNSKVNNHFVCLKDQNNIVGAIVAFQMNLRDAFTAISPFL